MESISHQIENSTFYNSKEVTNLHGPINDSLKVYGLKGIWTGNNETYKFHPSPMSGQRKRTLKFLNQIERSRYI